MPEIDEAQLKKQLAAGEAGRLYLVAGEEKYLVKRAAGRLMKQAEDGEFPEFNLNKFGGGAPMESIADAAQAVPLFAQRKYVFVSDWNVEEKDAAELDRLYELLKLSPESTTLVFWFPTLDFDGKKSAKWKKLLKAAQDLGNLLWCERRGQGDLEKMLVREAEKAGCALSRQNAGRIVEYAGQDVTQLLNEMEKLCAYALGKEAKETGKAPEITVGMIEELVPKSTETTVFLMANALTAGNYEKAYSLLDALLYQNEEPIAILGALSSSYIDMYRVRGALESGQPSSAAAAYGEYKGREFRLRNAERNAKGLKPEALRESLDLLLEADLALKGSKLDGRIVLEELVAKLLLAARRERS